MSWYTTPGTVVSAQGKGRTVFVGHSSKGIEHTLTFEEGTDSEESDAAGTRKLTESCLHEEQGDATQDQYRQVRHQECPCVEKRSVRISRSGFGGRRNLTSKSVLLNCYVSVE